MNGYLMGIDVGSQGVKGVLCDPTGCPLGTASEPCSFFHSASGWAEQDPRQWRQGVAAVVHKLTRQHDINASAVSHIAMACQVDGLVALDDQLRPLRPAIIWLDRRATSQAKQLADHVGPDRLFQITGLNGDASHTAPKIMWLRAMETPIYSRTRWFAPVLGYMLSWLVGAVVQDHANASSSLLFDIREGRWSDILLNAAEVDPVRLAPIVASEQVAGKVTSAAAVETGLSEDCLVVVGTGDDQAATLGAGVLDPGCIVDVCGTAEPVTCVSPTPTFDPDCLVELHCHAFGHMLLLENPGFVSGGSTLWLASSLFDVSQLELMTLASQAPRGSDGVLFIPSLSGATTPRWNDRMRGVFSGLSMNHGRKHLARAVVEGCSYALRDIVDQLQRLGAESTEIRVVGGGSRSDLWLQVKADVTGLCLRRVMNDEATATGAAILAATASGAVPDPESAVDRMVQLGDCISPSVDRAVYDYGYRQYRSVFDHMEIAMTSSG